MKQVTLRKIGLDDLKQLGEIGKQTFTETFAANNSEADMQAYLESRFSYDQLSAELKDKNSIFYFAELDKQVIGYLKINLGNAQTEITNENTLEIERIYVLEKFHGKQVGQLLCDKALEIARRKKLVFIWLGVWEHNAQAIRFYEKNGFLAYDKHLFVLGDDEQTDILMRLKLD